jgi:glucan phosphoethanolaminetransferase (alkaline phosphatase superfamily)
MVTSYNLFTSVSWIITGLISAILSSLFLAKNPKKRLNQLFSAGFIAWSLSMVLNGILFAVAYRSLTAANILRDFAVVFGVLSAFILFAAAYGIYFGAESLNWILYISSIIIAGVLSGFGAVNDWVTLDGLGGFKTTDNLIGKICTQIITAVFVVAANVLLILTYRSSKNPQAKKRVGFFVIGYSTIIIGLLMFVIDSFIQISPYVFPTFALIAWVMGPILMLIGFYVKAESDSPTLAKEAAMSESQLLKTKQEQKIERPS